jgi:hypothetical protein
VDLEGFGMPASRPAQAQTLRKVDGWFKTVHAGGMNLKSYNSLEDVAQRLIKTNPDWAATKRGWLARRWARPNAQGHGISWAMQLTKPPVLSCFGSRKCRRFTNASTRRCCVVADTDSLRAPMVAGQIHLGRVQATLAGGAQASPCSQVIQDAGHMLTDQPDALAQLIEDFL